MGAPWRAVVCVAGAYAIVWLSTAAASLAAQPPLQTVVARPPVTWLVFLDDLHLDFRNTGRIRSALRTAHERLSDEIISARQLGVTIFGLDLKFDEPEIDPNDPMARMHRAARQESLRSISEPTGGFVVTLADLAPGLTRIGTSIRQ